MLGEVYGRSMGGLTGGLEGKQEKGIFKDWKITKTYVISFEPTKQIHLIFNREVAKGTKKADDNYASALYDGLMKSNLLKIICGTHLP